MYNIRLDGHVLYSVIENGCYPLLHLDSVALAVRVPARSKIFGRQERRVESHASPRLLLRDTAPIKHIYIFALC